MVVLVVAVVIVALTVLGSGSGVPPGTPNGLQFKELLPKSQALPAGWRVTYLPAESASYVPPGTEPPVPISACTDFNEGFDLGIAGDTFVSSASETARDGLGFLRINLFGVLPGDGAKAISAVRSWVGQCSSYTFGPAIYTVTAAPMPGLGSESLDVQVTTPQAARGLSSVTDNNTLVVRVGNDLISIECLASPGMLLSPRALAAIAAPMVRRLPTASSLAFSVPPAPPSSKPRPAPALSPNLTDGQLERLLPARSGLPPEYYGTYTPPVVSDSIGDEVPPYARSKALTCSELPTFVGASALFTSVESNFRGEAQLTAGDENSDSINVYLAEPGTAALTGSDFDGLQVAAARCPQFGYHQETFRTTVRSVPGLGNGDVYLKMTPVSGAAAGGVGVQEILLVRVGNDGLVMVGCAMTYPDPAPPIVPIARSLVQELAASAAPRKH